LKRRREERGLSLDDLSRATKINKATLRALELTDVPHLPATIYTRGFIKAYAREVGLDPDRTAEDYLREIGSFHADPAEDDGPAQVERAESLDANGEARALLADNRMRRFTRATFALAVVGLVAYIASFYRSDSAEPIQPAEVVASEAQDVVRANGEAVQPGDAVASTMAGATFRIELLPQGPCWVSARVDGGRVVSRLMQAGERLTLDISDEAVLRVGEPGALAFSINGQSGRPFGRAGQPITVRITKDNFRDFLSS
jgi:transcriptional regulator with XRE-family HTH domain